MIAILLLAGDSPLYFILSMLFLWMVFDILDRITNNGDQ